MVNWTQEQEEAIYTDGRDMLVAAAAGSGKTAVLVERIIQKIIREHQPENIDSLLVVTFTNAAAQEMRNRVGEALEEKLEENPSSNHLKKQLSLLQRAPISTLHSFCLDIVKRYAYLLDMDPAFRIADNMETDLIMEDVMDDLFEEWYGAKGDEQQDFFAVVDRFSGDRSDKDVETLVRQLYTFAMQHPDPDSWLDSLSAAYDIPKDWHEDDLDWLNIIKQEVSYEFAAIEEELKRAMELTRETNGPYHYADTIDKERLQLQEAKAMSNSWKDLQAFMSSSSFSKLPSKKVDCDEDKKQQAKNLRDSYKKRWNAMKDNWFSRNLEAHVADMQELAPVIKQLTKLVKQFKSRYKESKREQAIVDFSDLEHYCLQLLRRNDNDNEKVIPSDLALNLKNQFNEVLIDEYQDTNLVQETILQLISDQEGPGNRFMVGDVKQSIYRFRHAEPDLFIDKYKRFADENLAAKRVDLASNFRSRELILSGTNYIFRQLMDEDAGDINYDAEAELIYANTSYDTLPLRDSEPELLIIDREAPEEDDPSSDAGENYQDLENAQLEARAYAEKIKNWIGHTNEEPLQVYDKTIDIQRDIQYRDIVILLRSMTWAPTIMDELKQQGIPVYADLSTGYFEAMEVQIMLNFLKVIDNPRQDIPLASVLKSPIVGINEEGLAQIRLADRKGTFYDALVAYNQENKKEIIPKTVDFLDKLERFRRIARQGALSDLIWQIYRETGYFDFVGGMPGGRQRQANLRALYDRARGYETTSFRGLFRFLRFIERMEERGDDLGAARALSEQEDVVRIMTIHSSKGLEFPAVILGALNKEFNMRDLNARYLLHKDLGFASKYIDPVKRITYPTLFHHALKQEKRREQLAEEMRILYVAMTRAKEKLLMVGNVKSFAKKQERWEQMMNHDKWTLPAYYRMDSVSYLDWLGSALIRHNMNSTLRTQDVSEDVPQSITEDASQWNVSVLHASDFTDIAHASNEEMINLRENIVQWKPLDIDNNVYEQVVHNRLSYVYPYEQASHSRAKQTVTEIKRQRETADEYSDDRFVRSPQQPIVKRPAFMQKQQTISAAERGTAMHTVMQHVSFNDAMSAAELSEFVESLVERELLTRQEADAVDLSAIEAFYYTNIGKKMMNASFLYREVPFSLSIPANEIYTDWQGDTSDYVLVQGVIDCVIPAEDGWIIIDYKTDSVNEPVTDKLEQTLALRYKIQMNLYRRALEDILKEPVTASYLYFFNAKTSIEA